MAVAAPRGRPAPSACHTRAVLSDEAVTMLRPSGLKLAEVTGTSWPCSTTGAPWPSACHTRAVLSHEAVTMLRPSGLKLAEVTAS